MGGPWVPLHHEASLEHLFEESHSGAFGMIIWGYVGRVWENFQKNLR